VQSRFVSSIVERKSAPANSFSVIADDSRAATAAAAAAAAVAEERIHQSRPPSALWLINTTRTATNCLYTVQHAAQLRTDVRPLPVLRSARVFFSSFSYFLPARLYASAGISYDPVSVCLCLSVCLSVTSWCSVEMRGRIELVFGVWTSFDLSYTVL